VVATPTVAGEPGDDWQQWMCAAVSGVVRPLNVAAICIVLAVGSNTIVARPVPGEPVGGVSFAPERSAVKVIGIAWAAGAGSIRGAAIMTNAGRGMSALNVMTFLRRPSGR